MCALRHVFLISGLLWGPSAYGADGKARPASFVTADGVTIVGDFYPGQAGAKSKSPVVILLHMYKRDRTSWAPLIDALHQEGFVILAIDLRGHGESVKPKSMNLAERVDSRDKKHFRAMWKDVAGAYNWLARQPGVDRSRLALIGASVGCSVAIDYAGRDKSVDAVVCLTPGKEYLGVNSTRHIGKFGKRRMLMLASEMERADAEYLANLVPTVEARIVPQGSAGPQDLHGTNMFERVPNIENRIVEYLKKNVGPRTKEAEHVFVSLSGEVYHAPTSHWVSRIKPENLREFSSAAEAAARGYRGPKRKGGSD